MEGDIDFSLNSLKGTGIIADRSAWEFHAGFLRDNQISA